MTREEAIKKYHHQLWGIMLEASRYKGESSARSMLEEKLMAKIDAAIGAIWADSQPPKPKDAAK